jgi:alpha-L-fucosidase
MPPSVPYEPTRDSLAAHAVPPWFGDAKFGIMIHWGIYTIPAWAPLEIDPADWLSGKLIEPPDYGREFFTKIPYVEWYPNSLLIDGSPVELHHAATYGPTVAYDDFRPQFDAAAAAWSADAWADAFAAAGAQYVVLVTKHHDGYALWPTDVPHPTRTGWHTTRDFVGELTTAVRRRCLRMGLYYSGGLDWSVKPGPITDVLSVPGVIPTSAEYVAYANAQWRELIERYEPAILWNDIGYPSDAAALELFADYYNAVPDGVVNDRFSVLAGQTHHDYVTPEFTVLPDVSEKKFETVRGMGRGFGYNRNETDADYDSATALIHLLVDVVSKNGNLLLNVGPMADGTIPAPQVARLQAIGAWLATNGESIFATRPWTRAEGETGAGTPVRFTGSADGTTLYAIVLGPVAPGPVTLVGLGETPRTAELLGTPGTLAVAPVGDDVRIEVPGPVEPQAASVFALRR